MKGFVRALALLIMILSCVVFFAGCNQQNNFADVSKEIYLPDDDNEAGGNNTVEAEIGSIDKKYYHEAVYDNPYVDTIKFSVGGIVSSVDIEDGQTVKKGEVLAQLNTDEIDKQIEEQKLRLDSAKKTLTKLNKDKDADSNEISSAEYDVQIEQNAYDQLLFELENYTIKAPYKGEVNIQLEEGKEIKKGSQVAEGQQLCRMSNPDGERLCVEIYDDEQFDDVSFGTNVTLTQGEITESGKVTDIVFKDGGESYSSYYYVITPNKKKSKLDRSGGTIDASIEVYSKENVVIVPTEAIKTVNEKYYVDVLVDGVKIQTDVEIGIQDDSDTEIVSGLSGGEEIILQSS